MLYSRLGAPRKALLESLSFAWEQVDTSKIFVMTMTQSTRPHWVSSYDRNYHHLLRLWIQYKTVRCCSCFSKWGHYKRAIIEALLQCSALQDIWNNLQTSKSIVWFEKNLAHLLLEGKRITYSKVRIQEINVELIRIFEAGWCFYCIYHPNLCGWLDFHLWRPKTAGNGHREFHSCLDGTIEPLNWYLGVHISTQDGKMTLSETAYVNEVLEQFQLQNCQMYSTPIISNFYDELTRCASKAVIEGI